jgi:hypothetical protein
MDATYIGNLNEHSPIGQYEICPCLDFNHSGDDGYTQAYETLAQAEEESDAALGPVFNGLYLRMRDEVIQAGAAPTIHLRDFETFEDALGCVTVLNGVPEMSYGEGWEE